MLLAGSFILPGLLALAPVQAQTFTDCNPTQSQCPTKPGLPSTSYSVDFTHGRSDPAAWEKTGAGGSINFTQSGAEITIAKQGDSPTLVTSFYFLFGRAEVQVRSAPGRGIVTAVVLESDDLDEIDWEWLGSTPNEVQTNYFGKGNTTVYDRGGVTPIQDTQTMTHTYTMDWSPEAIQWSIDGVVVRTVAYSDANGGQNYPQTPMRLKLGIWAGGDPGNPNGTIKWAGGPTDFSQAPFTMLVERVSITNDAPAISYTYGDFSGSWESIIVEAPPGSSGPMLIADLPPAPPAPAAPVPEASAPALGASAPAAPVAPVAPVVPEAPVIPGAPAAPSPEADAPAPGTPVAPAGPEAPAAPVPETVAPVPKIGTPAEEDVVDEIQAEGRIEEDTDSETSGDEDAQQDDDESDETDATPEVRRRSLAGRLML